MTVMELVCADPILDVNIFYSLLWCVQKNVVMATYSIIMLIIMLCYLIDPFPSWWTAV